MNLLGYSITKLQKKAVPSLRPLSHYSTWWPIVRESTVGAWQRNVTVEAGSALSMWACYACVSLIAGDIAKLCLYLVERDSYGVWNEIENPAYSPVLRTPNRYQTIIKFIEQWIIQKLSRGNAYVLKQRDQRGVVNALYVLDSTRVTPLVTPEGSVYYEVKRDDLAQVRQESVTIPASEIIHDPMTPLYHPLCGVSPIYASGTAALQGLSISTNQEKFFTNGSFPGGFLSAPGAISDETAARLKATFEANYSGDNVGKVAVGGDGLEYKPFTMTAVDSQLIEQLQMTAEMVCSTFHVPPYMIGVGPPPPYANIEPLLQQYFAQAIQTLLVSLETSLEKGLGLGPDFGNRYGVEFNIDDLIWMDTATRTKAAGDAITSGALSPNESRKKYYGYGPVPGGESPYLQQQNFSLPALAERDADKPFSKPAAAPSAPSAASTTDSRVASFAAALRRKTHERYRRAA